MRDQFFGQNIDDGRKDENGQRFVNAWIFERIPDGKMGLKSAWD